MDAQQWLEQVHDELRRKKLPPLYVERFLSELSDHIFDSVEDPMSTDARELHKLTHHLGTPREIAATAAHEFHKAHFCRRHPVLMFVALPIVALPLAWTACLVVVLALAKAFGLETGGAGIGGAVHRWAEVNAQVVMLAMLVMPSAIAAALFEPRGAQGKRELEVDVDRVLNPGDSCRRGGRDDDHARRRHARFLHVWFRPEHAS